MPHQPNPYFMGNMGFYGEEWVLVWTPAGYVWERRFRGFPYSGPGMLMTNGTYR
jgi:hypothetical protein